MYAIIQTGGKQYRVTPGDILAVERLDGKNGDVITFKELLLIAGAADKQVHIGAPFVSNASAQAEIVDDETKADKLLTIKYRRRKGYRRTIGHRQGLTRLLITKIDSGTGAVEQFDENKRKDVLVKASVKFSKRRELRASKAKAPAAKKTVKKTVKAKKAD
jgi:large subunit ribosomal protein L21